MLNGIGTLFSPYIDILFSQWLFEKSKYSTENRQKALANLSKLLKKTLFYISQVIQTTQDLFCFKLQTDLKSVLTNLIF